MRGWGLWLVVGLIVAGFAVPGEEQYVEDLMREGQRRLGDRGAAVGGYAVEPSVTPERARTLMQQASADPDALLAQVAKAAALLRTQHRATGVAVLGWCFGGGWSLQTALRLPGEVDAAVVYYGRVVTDREQLAALDDPLLGLFGGADEGIPVDDVRRFAGLLEELDKDATIEIYEGAAHAFANPSGERYDAQAAEDAWRRTLEFLRRTLG